MRLRAPTQMWPGPDVPTAAGLPARSPRLDVASATTSRWSSSSTTDGLGGLGRDRLGRQRRASPAPCSPQVVVGDIAAAPSASRSRWRGPTRARRGRLELVSDPDWQRRAVPRILRPARHPAARSRGAIHARARPSADRDRRGSLAVRPHGSGVGILDAVAIEGRRRGPCRWPSTSTTRRARSPRRVAPSGSADRRGRERLPRRPAPRSAAARRRSATACESTSVAFAQLRASRRRPRAARLGREGPRAARCVAADRARTSIALADAVRPVLGAPASSLVGDGPLRPASWRSPTSRGSRVAAVERLPGCDAACADVLCQSSLIEPIGQATLERPGVRAPPSARDQRPAWTDPSSCRRRPACSSSAGERRRHLRDRAAHRAARLPTQPSRPRPRPRRDRHAGGRRRAVTRRRGA